MELNLKDLKELLCNNNKDESFLIIGTNYFIRTVTMIYTGRLIKENKESLLLEKCCWIADTGRFADSLKSCNFNEVEPYYKDVVLFKNGILDITEIDRLPEKQK